MQMLIDIPKETYEALMINQYCGSKSELENIIVNGTPLPEHHGRLIDADDIRVIELEDSLHIIRHEKGDDIDVYIDAPTIINN